MAQSDKNRTDWSVQNFSKDVMFLSQTLLSLKNVVLIGHSMGGNIILEPSITMPDLVIGFVGVDNFKDLAVEYTPMSRKWKWMLLWIMIRHGL
jgi:sigma-B regulation protein RsbQ